MFTFLDHFVAAVYQINCAEELPENDKDGCFHKLIHLKTQVQSTQVFWENLFFPVFRHVVHGSDGFCLCDKCFQSGTRFTGIFLCTLCYMTTEIESRLYSQKIHVWPCLIL